MVVESYSDEGIVLNGETYTQSFCLYPDRIQKLEVENLLDIRTEVLPEVLADVVLLGVSENVSSDDIMSLKMTGLNIDVMDVGSACRTYNLLLAEGRRVVLIVYLKS